jgi:hypothetical protein
MRIRSAWALSVLVFACDDQDVTSTPGDGQTPTVLAANQTSPWTIAIDDENVYWVNAGEFGGLYKVPKAGGTVTALYEGAMPEVESLGFDATSIYFPSRDSIVALPREGGPARIIASSSETRGVADVNDRVYWIEASCDPQTPTVAKSVATAGGEPTTIELPKGVSPTGAHSTVAGRDAVYATMLSGGVEPGLGVVRIPLQDSPRALVDTSEALGIALDPDNVYFSTRETLEVVPRSGGVSRRLALAHASYSVTVDDSSVYISSQDRVLKVAKKDARVTVLAEDQISPHSIAVDDKYVYWNCLGEGTIKKIAK